MIPVGVAAQTTVKYVHTDALGSVVAMTDASGAVVDEHREYEAYGQQLTPAVQDGPGYTGHVQDAATGLTYMQQRYYDPAIGRFLSTDPVTALSNPTSLFNRYRYAANNPYRFTDPDGRMDRETRKELAAVRAAARTEGFSAAADGASLAGLAMGVGEVVVQKEANAWAATAGKGSGPAAAGAMANAADLAKVGRALAQGGAAVAIVTGGIEAASADNAADMAHGVATLALGIGSVSTLIPAPVTLAAGALDMAVQHTEFTSPGTGETSSGWSGLMGVHSEIVEKKTEHGEF